MTDDKHLKIAMLGHKRVPSREGGVEIVVEELSKRMVKKGHQVTCFNRRGNYVNGETLNTEKLKEYEGIVLKSVTTIDKKGLAAMTSSFFAACRAAIGPYDVVHFHAEGPCAMIWIPKMLGKRCIVTIHGLDHQRAKWGNFASKYIMFGEKMAAQFANEVIVLSKNVQKYFKEKYGRNTIFIPNGVNKPIPQKADLITRTFGLNKDEYILYLGRIVPEKGLEYLIKAFKNVHTEKKLVIAGGASDTQEFMEKLKQMAKDDQRIIFTGFVKGKMLEELYSNAYIYTLPSDLEGMPLSLLEAMSYGNCCLVSDIDECTEVVENQAIIFEKSNIENLQDKLQMLCDHTNIVYSYKKNATHYICSKYNWDNVTKETLELYREVKK